VNGDGHLLPDVPVGEDALPVGKPAGGNGDSTEASPGETGGKPSGRKGADALVLALATGLSVPQAAKRARIGTSSAYRRMEDPAFRAEVRRARDDLLHQALAKLVSAACQAVDTLTENLGDESPVVRNKAAATILANMISGVQLAEILRRLEALEEGPPHAR
jgi:hypothetical protein